MTGLTPSERRAELDRRLDAALDVPDGTSLDLARSTVLDRPDRWYGQFVALSHDAIADARGGDAVLSAATAVELLRGYCRLRAEQFAHLDGDAVDSPVRDPTAALLAGDYLDSAAYAALGAVDHDRSRDAFEVLLDVSASLVEAFDAGDATAAAEPGAFLDRTVGGLGAGAAVVGATLGGAGESRRDRFAAVGRGFSTAREAQRRLRSPASAACIPATVVDEHRFREHAADHLADAERALEDLAATVDAEPLRSFVDDALTEFDAA